MTKAVQIWWDWKASMPVEQLKEIGIHVYPDPMTEGSDTYGYIFSLEPLTPEDYRETIKEHAGLDDEEAEEYVQYFREYSHEL